MALIQWDSSLSVGVRAMDEQHDARARATQPGAGLDPLAHVDLRLLTVDRGRHRAHRHVVVDRQQLFGIVGEYSTSLIGVPAGPIT